MENLGKKLKKELLRNTKQTVVLASISVIAIWMWAPLAWKYLSGKEASDGQPTVAADAAEAVSSRQLPVAAADAGNKEEHKTFNFAWWPTIMKAMQDTQAKPHPPDEIVRNPFAVATSPAAGEVVEEEPVEQPPDLLFDSLGLTLNSTIVGKRFKAAKINGETYQPGDLVSPLGFDQIKSSDAIPPVQLTLTEIQETFVRLEHRGKLYELELKRIGKPVGEKIIMRGSRVVAR